jgi:hypothetical protein
MKYDATYGIAMRRDAEMAESQSGLSKSRQDIGTTAYVWTVRVWELVQFTESYWFLK